MARFDIDEQQIRQLAELLHETGLSEIEITEGKLHIRLVRMPPPPSTSVQSTQDSQPIIPSHSSSQHHTTSRTENLPAGTIFSPMVGTIYLASEPGSEPFVHVGKKVEKDQVLFIIEAMKVMNQIRAHTSGIVKKIFIANGHPVEYGEPLIIIE